MDAVKAIDRMQTLEDAREQIAVRNPITGEIIGHTPISTPEDIVQAAARARAAQPAWEALGVKARGRLLRRWADALMRDPKRMMRVIRRETGKTDGGAFNELIIVDVMADHYAREAPRLLKPKPGRPFLPLVLTAKVFYKPRGVIGFITPWNYPLGLCLNDVIPALIAGNAALIKPSELTPFTALEAVQMMYEVGIPRDIVQVLTGDGRTGAALIDHVDYVAFTGSTTTGRKVALRAAERLIPYSLELGGNDPAIVLADSDLDLAATSLLMGALENAGQVCASVERVYVEEAIYDRFVERLLHYAGQIVLGSGDGFDVHMGSMIDERELRRSEEHIADAVAKGARVLMGGRRRPDLGPLFFEPTILVDVDHGMRIMREETFGPLIPIMKVRDVEEAVRLANDSEYGLSATIFTRNLRRGEQIALNIESGDVAINHPQVSFGTPSVPMGGEKQSGVGRRHGVEGLMRFVKPQSVIARRPGWMPNSVVHVSPPIYRLYPLWRRIRRWLP